MGELAERRAQTEARIVELQKRLKNAARIAAGKACVYATGSFGRCEASPHSDLDLFIVGKAGRKDKNGDRPSLLTHLNEIRIMADLIEVTREFEIPDFSGDGRYLAHYSVHELTKTLGTPEDDVTNTFTARMLLLLESKPLVGSKAYSKVMQDVIAGYWRDYEDHKSNFVPAFLTNDILRLWRTFCVNYEARTERVPEKAKAKGKLKNYKLKHSRLLTCYSAILYLLAVYTQQDTVTPADALTMTTLTPTERLEWLLQQGLPGHHATVTLLDQYERFLRTTNAPEEQLVARFLDKSDARKLMQEAQEFGDTMFTALTQIGAGKTLHRLLVV